MLICLYHKNQSEAITLKTLISLLKEEEGNMIYKKKAIKNWWLLKNGYNYMRYIKDLGVKKETEKAVLIFYKTELGEWTAWVPKSVLCDEWENDPYAYRAYLEATYHRAYKEQYIKNFVIRSSMRGAFYAGDQFVGQWKTKELVDELTKKNIPFMTKKEFEEENKKVNDTSLDYQVNYIETKDFENKYNELMKNITKII